MPKKLAGTVALQSDCTSVRKGDTTMFKIYGMNHYSQTEGHSCNRHIKVHCYDPIACCIEPKLPNLHVRIYTYNLLQPSQEKNNINISIITTS